MQPVTATVLVELVFQHPGPSRIQVSKAVQSTLNMEYDDRTDDLSFPREVNVVDVTIFDPNLVVQK